MKGNVLLIWIVAMLLLATSACRERYLKISLPNDRLIPILCDIHIAEAAVQQVNGARKDSLNEVYLDQICTIHQISRERLDEVLEELRNNPDAMKKAYLAVAQALEERRTAQ